MKITRFEDIEGWKAARKLAQALSRRARQGAWFRDSFLANQARRCALSAMANIAEGFDSGTNREFNRFLRISYRSVSELQSHLYAALDEAYIDQAVFASLYDQCRQTKSLIAGFIRYLKSRC
jgi:four helix bundle protein